MRSRPLLSLASLVAVTAAGCSSNSSSPVAPISSPPNAQSFTFARAAALRIAAAAPKDRSPSVLDRAAFRRALVDRSLGLLFACDAYHGTVDIYIYRSTPGTTQNQTRIGHITGFNSPDAIAVDNRGELYVADIGTKEVEMFTVDSFPNAAYTIPFPYAPTGIAVDPTGSTVYISGDVPFANGQLGVAAYKPRTATPFQILSDANILATENPFLDSAGNVYLGVSGFPEGNIGVFPKGSSQLALFDLSETAQYSTYEGSLDSAGDLIVSDPNNSTIDTYANNATSSTPTSTFPVNAHGDLIFYTYNQRQTQLFSTELNFSSTGQYVGTPITQYDFPSGTVDNQIVGPANALYIFGLATYPVAPLQPAFNHPTTPATTPAPSPSGPTNVS